MLGFHADLILVADKRRCRAQVEMFLGVLSIWGLPEIRDTLLVVPITRIIELWGLYWGPIL